MGNVRKQNIWERLGFYGTHPKKFKKEAREQIKTSTLNEIKNRGRGQWVSTADIYENNLKYTDVFQRKEGTMFFAESGIKAKINSATHFLREEGHPIISGKGHKGYRYADESCEDFIRRWDEVLSAREERKSNLEREYKIYQKLIEKIIERLISKNRLKEANELKVVLERYRS